jgi:speckle-type POZ protein
LEWNVQVPFLQTTDGIGQLLESPLFSPQETPNSKWQLEVYDVRHSLRIVTLHCNSTEQEVNFVEPVLVKLSILNNRRKKVFQQMVSSAPTTYYVQFNFSKEDLIKSNSQQSDGSLTFYCKILTHVKRVAPADPRPVGVAINSPNELSTQFGELFDKMPSSDVNFNICDRQFPAHKLILAARSEVFDAMFKQPMKEQSTNKIKIEDIQPEVFQELLRFIYTGRVSTATMETMAVGLFIAADKYMLNGLKNKCENYLLHDMSPDNCIELLLNSNLMNSAEQLKKEAAKSFRRFPLQVMATSQWQTLEKENPAALVAIQKIVFSHN